MDKKLKRINAVWLTVNRSCNNRCKWCYAQETNFSKEDNMSIEKLKKLVSICKTLDTDTVMLIGGEPTLYPYLEEAIKICVKEGIKPHLITNGRRFKSRSFTEKLAKIGLKSVSISIKATDREQHILLTGVDGYNDVVKGIQELVRSNIEIGLSITITKTMMENPIKLIKSITALGPFELFVEFANPAVSNDVVLIEEVPSPEDIANYCETLYPLLEEHGTNYLFNVGIPLCLFSDDFLKKVMESQRIMSVCHVRSGSGVIFLQNGDVIPCHQFLKNEVGKYGIDFTNGTEFFQFWNGPKSQALVNASNCFPSEKCAECSLWKICGGGCMMKWFGFNPKNIKLQPKIAA